MTTLQIRSRIPRIDRRAWRSSPALAVRRGNRGKHKKNNERLRCGFIRCVSAEVQQELRDEGTEKPRKEETKKRNGWWHRRAQVIVHPRKNGGKHNSLDNNNRDAFHRDAIKHRPWFAFSLPRALSVFFSLLLLILLLLLLFFLFCLWCSSSVVHT